MSTVRTDCEGRTDLWEKEPVADRRKLYYNHLDKRMPGKWTCWTIAAAALRDGAGRRVAETLKIREKSL